jgi:hypothetical protein
VTSAPTIVITSLEGLQATLRERAEAIGISREQIDRHAGFTSGYSSKVLAPAPMKRLSVESACQLAPALGLDLALVENADYLARIRSRSPLREANHALHAGAVQFNFSFRYLRQIAKKGGQNSRKYMSPRQAKKLAQRAANARWAKEPAL